jgi:Skp family chaperone for outer membrane proteins
MSSSQLLFKTPLEYPLPKSLRSFMKKSFIALATIFTLSSLSANASTIGVLDVEKIVKESIAMRDIQSKVSKKQDEYQKDVNKRQKELEAEQKKLEGKKNVLSKEALENEMKAFETKIDGLKELVDKKQNSLKKASVDGMGKVNDKIKDIIAEISKEKEIDLIIPSTQALFYKDELDISAEVLAKLNKKITKVDVKFE